MAGPFYLNYPSLGDVWDDTLDPTTQPATYTDVPMQVYTESRPPYFGTPAIYQIRFPVDLLQTWKPNYLVNCPKGSNRWWKVSTLYWVHLGFSNEYWAAMVLGFQLDPTVHPLWLP